MSKCYWKRTGLLAAKLRCLANFYPVAKRCIHRISAFSVGRKTLFHFNQLESLLLLYFPSLIGNISHFIRPVVLSIPISIRNHGLKDFYFQNTLLAQNCCDLVILSVIAELEPDILVDFALHAVLMFRSLEREMPVFSLHSPKINV